MSRRARKESTLNYTALTFAFLGLAILAIAGILPYWITFLSDYSIGWGNRNMGLLKVSGKYTNVIMTGADITWIQIRDTICGQSAAFTTMGAGTSSLGAANAIGNAMMGVNCIPSCKAHMTQRCLRYYQMTFLNLGIWGMLIIGSLVSITGTVMPLIGKERKKDRATWLLLDVAGFILAVAALLAFYFYYNMAFNTLRTTSYFQMHSIGWCFWLACFGAVCLIVPCVLQSIKISTAEDKKPADGPEGSQLLTSGASPDFMMPSTF